MRVMTQKPEKALFAEESGNTSYLLQHIAKHFPERMDSARKVVRVHFSQIAKKGVIRATN